MSDIVRGNYDEVQHWVCESTDLPFFARDPQSCPHCGNDDLPMADGHYRPMPNEVYSVKSILNNEQKNSDDGEEVQRD